MIYHLGHVGSYNGIERTNIMVLQKYTCNLVLRRRPNFLMPKTLKALELYKCFEQLKKEGS